MKDDTAVAMGAFLIVGVVGALLYALGYAIHLDAVRSDQARIACMADGRSWVKMSGGEPICLRVAQ